MGSPLGKGNFQDEPKLNDMLEPEAEVKGALSDQSSVRKQEAVWA